MKPRGLNAAYAKELDMGLTARDIRTGGGAQRLRGLDESARRLLLGMSRPADGTEEMLKIERLGAAEVARRFGVSEDSIARAGGVDKLQAMDESARKVLLNEFKKKPSRRVDSHEAVGQRA